MEDLHILADLLDAIQAIMYLTLLDNTDVGLSPKLRSCMGICIAHV